MKRKFTFLLAALLLMSGLTWAQQITWTAAEQGYENGQVIDSVDFDDYVSATFDKGTNNNAPKYYTSGAAIRCYGGNYFTVTSDYLLTEIVLGLGSGGGTNEITTDCGTYTDGTWTGSANSVTFTIGGTTGHRRFATFTITYTESGTPAPTITIENNNELAYNATSGSFNFTVNNPVSGGSMSVATEEEWISNPTIAGSAVNFATTVNQAGVPREGIITLTYTYGEQAVTKSVTVIQAGNPNVVDNIYDITADGTYAVQGTIVAINSRGFILGDGTGYVYYFYGTSGFEPGDYDIGDMVKLTGSVIDYGGVFEFNNTTEITYVSESNYVEEEPTVLSGAEMDARVASTTPPQLSSYVQYEGTLTVSGNYYNITNIAGATTAKGSISYPLNGEEIAALNGKQVVVKGYYVGVSSSQYYNTMIGSVEEKTDPAILLDTYAIEMPAEGGEGDINVTYQNLDVSAENLAVVFYDGNGDYVEPDTYDWITAEIDENYNVHYVVDASQGAARTAYFKVEYSIAIVEDWKSSRDGGYWVAGGYESDLVTVSQEAYVAPTYAELPFEFDGGRADIAETDGLYQEGLDSDYSNSPKLKFNTTGDWLLLQFNGVPGTLTFDIKGNPGGNPSVWAGTFKVQTSVDGETYTDLGVYTDLTTTVQSESFNLSENVRYIKWIYAEKSSGNVALGNIHLYELGGGPVTEYDLTVEPFENLEIFTFVGGDESETALEGAGTIQVTVGDQVMLSITANEGYVIQSLMVDGVEHMNDITDDETYTFIMPDHNVTISATAVEDVPPTPGNWVLTDLADLTENDVFVIVGTKNGVSYAMSNNNGTSVAPATIGVTVVDNTLSGEIADTLQWNISGDATNGYTFYPKGDTENWLYCTNTNNGVRVGTNDNYVFTFVSGGVVNGVEQANYLFNTATERFVGMYLDNAEWRCYTSINNNIKDQSFAFYKKVNAEQTQTIALAEGWNWVSFNVETTLADLKAAINAVAQAGDRPIIKSQSNGQVKKNANNNNWMGQLTSLDMSQMYKIQIGADCEIVLQGLPVDPAEHPATIVNGANWIAYPLSESMSVAEAFSGFDATNGDNIKSQRDGQTNKRGNGWMGQLQTLVPGNGYIYNSKATTTKTWVFPTPNPAK